MKNLVQIIISKYTTLISQNFITMFKKLYNKVLLDILFLLILVSLFFIGLLMVSISSALYLNELYGNNYQGFLISGIGIFFIFLILCIIKKLIRIIFF